MLWVQSSAFTSSSLWLRQWKCSLLLLAPSVHRLQMVWECVCVWTEWTWSMQDVCISTYQFILCYAGATHKYTHASSKSPTMWGQWTNRVKSGYCPQKCLTLNVTHWWNSKWVTTFCSSGFSSSTTSHQCLQWEGGDHGEQCHSPCCVPCTHQTRHCQLCSLRNEKERQAAICCLSKSW